MASSLFGKAYTLLKTRPAEFFSAVRGYLLFSYTRLYFQLLGIPEGVTLGQNIRIQRARSLQVERSGALLNVGDHSILYEHALVEVRGDGRVEIGRESILGDIRIVCRNSITIGSHFLSSWNVFLQDFDPHPLVGSERQKQVASMVRDFRPQFDSPEFDQCERYSFQFPSEPIVIGTNVWVGANVTILKGVTIGDNSIVATGAVVLRGEYPPNSVLAGNPARVVKTLHSNEKPS
ncbi:MAG: acyltransferase [Bdellovibrionales bacterium]|nr:acyltransferase [Bdellovibrionales bacterium]